MQHGSDSLSIKENDIVEGYYLAHVGIRNAEQISVKEEEFDVWRGPNKKWKALRYVAMREQHLGVMVSRAQEIQETFPDYCLYLYEMSDVCLLPHLVVLLANGVAELLVGGCAPQGYQSLPGGTEWMGSPTGERGRVVHSCAT